MYILSNTEVEAVAGATLAEDIGEAVGHAVGEAVNALESASDGLRQVVGSLTLRIPPIV